MEERVFSIMKTNWNYTTWSCATTLHQVRGRNCSSGGSMTQTDAACIPSSASFEEVMLHGGGFFVFFVQSVEKAETRISNESSPKCKLLQFETTKDNDAMSMQAPHTTQEINGGQDEPIKSNIIQVQPPTAIAIISVVSWLLSISRTFGFMEKIVKMNKLFRKEQVVNTKDILLQEIFKVVDVLQNLKNTMKSWDGLLNISEEAVSCVLKELCQHCKTFTKVCDVFCVQLFAVISWNFAWEFFSLIVATTKKTNLLFYVLCFMIRRTTDWAVNTDNVSSFLSSHGEITPTLIHVEKNLSKRNYFERTLCAKTFRIFFTLDFETEKTQRDKNNGATIPFWKRFELFPLCVLKGEGKKNYPIGILKPGESVHALMVWRAVSTEA